MKNYIKSINWIFTYKCNLKCKHCDIWKNPYNDELSLEKIEEIVSSKIMQDSFKYY
jgi:MoaA/NifB/PqqE/SkfB family radical SAM enzyme